MITRVYGTPEERFWPKVAWSEDTTVCWPWLAYTMKDGYGVFGLGGGVTTLAHRFAWEWAYGSIPDGMLIEHVCDVNYDKADISYRKCCNFYHILPGTKRSNAIHCVELNRSNKPKGEAQHKARLSASNVLDIRAEYASGLVTQEALSRAYGVSLSAIHFAINRRSWKHI